MTLRLFWYWALLVLVRFTWTLLPQTGYIHPDEFFQSVEIVAGDIFNVKILRSWEFNTTSPVRSIVPIYLTIGLPLYMLKIIVGFLGESYLTWYSVTVVARCTIALFSLLIDMTTYRLAEHFGHGKDASVASAFLVATSYVTLVFYTRTFSNTIEAFLFALLLYCAMHRSQVIQPSKSSSTNSVLTLPNRTDGDSCQSLDQLLVPSLIVVGFFNRPTFIVFAIVPYCYWLLCDVHLLRLDFWRILSKAVASLTTALPLAAIFVVCDSIYFGRLSIDPLYVARHFELHGLSSFLLSNFTVTPFNFLLYNVHSENLAKHGSHPRITHFAVNIPLLFGILAIMFFADLLKFTYLAVVRKPSPDNFRNALLLSCFVPTVLLSLFPHQEPRFLVPLLTPLAVLYGHRVIGKTASFWCVSVWILLNLAGGIFFGIFHQGGVVRSLGRLQQEHATNRDMKRTDVIFWHSYMPPRYLLLQNRDSCNCPLQSNCAVLDPCALHGIHIHDLAGQPTESLINHLALVHNSSAACSVKGDVRLVAPATLHQKLNCSLTRAAMNVELLTTFWPHFSSEDPPSLSCDNIVGCELEFKKCASLTLVDRLFTDLSLNVYRVSFL